MVYRCGMKAVDMLGGSSGRRASPIVGAFVTHLAHTFDDHVPGERTEHSLRRRPGCCRGAQETSQYLLDTLALKNEEDFSLLRNTMHKSRSLKMNTLTIHIK